MNTNYEQMLYDFILYSEKVLQSDELEEVKHYYQHDEYEMALEGLLIELISAGKYPDNFEFSIWKDLVINYGLNKESVFDEFIWNKFLEWGMNK